MGTQDGKFIGSRRSPSVVAELEVDRRELGPDSGALDYGTLPNSQAPSLSKSREVNGRRFHAYNETAYALPNDGIEITRLDIQHLIWHLSLDGALHLSPLQTDVKNIVDIGCGTGGWATEFAKAYPDVDVLGTDLSPIQEAEKAPRNCKFVQANAEDDWSFDTQFDLVRSRMLLFGIHDYERYLRQAWHATKPGGWVEVHEPEFLLGCMNDDDQSNAPLIRWCRLLVEAGDKAGIDMMISPRLADMMKQQGFVNVGDQGVKWPIGDWAKGWREKRIGKWMIPNIERFLDAVTLAWLPKYLAWTKEEAEALLREARKDLCDPSKRYYWQLHVCYGQKPQSCT